MNMYRIRGFGRLKVLLCGTIFPLSTSEDAVVDSPSLQALKNVDQGTGMDRLRFMFSLNEFGELNPGIYTSLQATLFGLFIGAGYGGFVWSKRAYTEYIENNQASVYHSHTEAKRALQDHVTINFAKGAFMWGWRVALFSGTLFLVSTSVSVYRGKSGILEYALGGGIAGLLYKTHLGFRGMLVGGLLGSVLGTCGGCVIYSLLKITGINMDEIRAIQYSTKFSRRDAVKQLRTKVIEGEDPPLIKSRDNIKSSLSSSLDVVDQSTK